MALKESGDQQLSVWRQILYLLYIKLGLQQSIIFIAESLNCQRMMWKLLLFANQKSYNGNCWPCCDLKILMKTNHLSGPHHHDGTQRVWDCREEAWPAGVAGGEHGSETCSPCTLWRLLHRRCLHLALHHQGSLIQCSFMDWYWILCWQPNS